MKATAMAVISIFLGLILASQAMAAVKYESLERRNGLWQVRAPLPLFLGKPFGCRKNLPIQSSYVLRVASR